MTRPAWNLDYGPFRGFYRDRENGWLFGVCAGIADRFNLNLCALRVVAVVCLVAFTGFTVLVYAAAVVLIREKPLVYSGRENESEFWRRHRDQWRHS
jgi:phage shock protein C